MFWCLLLPLVLQVLLIFSCEVTRLRNDLCRFNSVGALNSTQSLTHSLRCSVSSDVTELSINHTAVLDVYRFRSEWVKCRNLNILKAIRRPCSSCV